MGVSSRTHRKYPAWFAPVGVVLSSLLGTLSWVMSLVLMTFGYLTIQKFGWSVPSWSWVFAFIVGMPLGGWIEFKLNAK